MWVVVVHSVGFGWPVAAPLRVGESASGRSCALLAFRFATRLLTGLLLLSMCCSASYAT